jgi:hypothetical protein
MRFTDYTNKVDPDFRDTRNPSIAEGKPPLRHFTSSWLERAREVMLSFGKDAVELHDPVAVWCAIENPPVKVEVFGGSPTMKQGWKVAKRKFEIERYRYWPFPVKRIIDVASRVGEFTRGMLVVDRREDAGAYAPGVNRAQAQSELERSVTTNHKSESSVIPAEVEVETASAHQEHGRSVSCVTETPGFEKAANLLFQRVWGIRDQASELGIQ